MPPPLPETPPPPPKGSLLGPLLANAVLLVVLYVVAYASGNGSAGDTAVMYFSALVGLLLVNVLAAMVAALAGKPQTALGFLFSILGIFLIGLGTCAYSLQHTAGN